MTKLLQHIVLIILALATTFSLRATHGMGGEITWECQGNGDYVFELIFYRDCNGFEVNTNFEELRVWGHPSVNSIEVDFVNRIDISPYCTAAGGEVPFDCGTGVSGGNGVGAVEKIIYRSSPVTLSGTPPADGWKLTYESFSRSGNLTNITNPTNYGITISATMFPIPGSPGGCIDNSPNFLQDPYVVSCAGEEYNYNPHAVDVDLDSLVFDWGVPYDYFPTGNYNPPTNPAPVPFEPGFSYDNPTPDATFNPNNVPASLDGQTGAMNFTSFTQGNFATKVRVSSYRKGVKISTVVREVQLIVSNCTGSNTPPFVAPPFNGNMDFDTTVFAGDLVNFNIASTDIGNLQDGSAQSNIITSTGLMYGANFTDPNNGCATPPCATLNNAPSATGSMGASMELNWQTTCDHLVDATGNAKDEVPYVFVFKVQDDYCPIPSVTYATVTITVKNKEVLPAPEIACIRTAPNGDVTINWTPVSDPNGVFDQYSINAVSGGNLGSENNVAASNHTVTGVGNNVNEFYVSTHSGCDGLSTNNSDTLSNIYLELNNPGNGEAELDWNAPSSTPLDHFGGYYHIYREYPTGNWNLIDSVPYAITNYTDTITICDAFLNYRIVLPTDKCDFRSNTEGDDFEDQIVPDIPNISNVSIDSITTEVTIEWDENSQKDTYGYVIYKTDNNGNLVEVDTVWGIGNTSFTHDPTITDGPLQYSIAAFDSCSTNNVPPTYQTSAKAAPHTSNFLTANLDICDRMAKLSWTGYKGFETIINNNIYARLNQSPWQIVGDTTANAYEIPINLGDELVVAIETVSGDGTSTLSNIDTIKFTDAGGPSYSYLSVATVDGDEAVVKHRLALDGGAETVVFERFDPAINDYEVLAEAQVGTQNEIPYVDQTAEVHRRPYTYRTEVIDTCGQSLGYSNIGKTMFLEVQTNETQEMHTLQWTPYDRFKGNLKEYAVYRAIDGVYESTPIAVLPTTQRTYTDSVQSFGSVDDGKICYYIAAIEGSNQWGVEKQSYSNEACGTIAPTIYIPNAFTVGGKNPVFKPVTRQHRIKNYSFEIFDRYGRLIFSTNDPAEGWKGQIEGSSRYAREGVYVYRLSLRDGNGSEVLKHGHVTLLDYR